VLQQEQGSAWKLTEPVPVQQEQEPVPELLVFSCSRQRKQATGTGKVRVKSSFSFDTYLFPFVINHCTKQGVYANQWGYYPSLICKVNTFL
jgi:hypothetical protein